MARLTREQRLGNVHESALNEFDRCQTAMRDERKVLAVASVLGGFAQSMKTMKTMRTKSSAFGSSRFMTLIPRSSLI